MIRWRRGSFVTGVMRHGLPVADPEIRYLTVRDVLAEVAPGEH